MKYLFYDLEKLDRRRFESAPTDSSSLGNPRKEFKGINLL